MVSFTKLFTAALLSASTFAAPLNIFQKRSGSKRGAAYNEAPLVSALSNGGAVSWAYNWNSSPDGDLPPGVSFIPMLWGQKSLDSWSSAVQSALSSGSKYILGFNEPDLPAQANMAVSDAASLYRENITPYADQATLVTPAVTNGNAQDQGLNWMSSFLESCSDCKASVMAIHWYGTDADDFKNHVTSAITLGQQHGIQEVWITEFGVNDISQAASFLLQVLPWLDSQAGVGGYAYFYCASGYLLEGTGLSASGQVYASS